uniref:Uncharacterized protein n=1 Tax=Arundo donax TaxID=35708 RepID=A0A0A9U519_ARUDO
MLLYHQTRISLAIKQEAASLQRNLQGREKQSWRGKQREDTHLFTTRSRNWFLLPHSLQSSFLHSFSHSSLLPCVSAPDPSQ